MATLKSIIYNCREATFLIEKRQITALTLTEKIKLTIHLAGCKFCRRFRRQSILINKILRYLFNTAPQSANGLDTSFKIQLQKLIEEKIKKTGNNL